MNLIEERTIALAGLLQACKLVQDLARTGQVDQADFDTSLQSILVLDAVNTPAVFGGVEGLRTGLGVLAQGVLRSPQGMDVEVLRYAMSLMHLQNQLFADDDKYTAFGQAIERLSSHAADELVDACSDVYQTHISNMRPQIIVQGEQDHLQDVDIPPKVRSLLLAGIRAAVLWQQKDGSKFKLLWQRTRMQNAAREFLARGTVH